MPHAHLTGARGALSLTGLQLLATMVRDGASTREMMAATGMSKNALTKKAREIRLRFEIKAPWEIEREAFVERVAQLLAAGGTNESIAAELGCDDKAVSLARAQLGLGHPTQIRLSEDEYARVDERLIAGERPRALAGSIGMSTDTIARRLKAIRHLVPADATCSCGRPYNHGATCRSDAAAKPKAEDVHLKRPPSSAEHRPRSVAPVAPPTTPLSRAARAIPLRPRKKAIEMACRGERRSTIRKALSLAKWPVEALCRDLGRAGLLPETCVCGRAHGHVGSCARAPRVRVAKPKVYRPKHPAMMDAATQRRMREQWEKGVSTRRIAEQFGLHLRTAQRFDRHWRSLMRKPGAPCACGRPFRHPGGCVRNTPGAVTTIEAERIVAAVRAGRTNKDIAADLGIDVMTVGRHARDTRQQMKADGQVFRRGSYSGVALRLAPGLDGEIMKRLLSGEGNTDITRATGVARATVRRRYLALTAEQRREREEAIVRAARRRAITEDQLKAAAELVPPSLEPAIRDDVVGELRLGLLEGVIDVAQVKPAVRQLISRVIARWQSLHGPASLDRPLHSDGGRTLAEVIGDATAGDELDQIEIGGSA